MMSSETKELFEEVRFTNDGDAFGTVQTWRFAIADVLYVCDEPVVGYQPSSLGVSLDGYEHHLIIALLARSRKRLTIGDLQYALKIFDRARAILAAMGKEY
jgi:hypothetical protein